MDIKIKENRNKIKNCIINSIVTFYRATQKGMTIYDVSRNLLLASYLNRETMFIDLKELLNELIYENNLHSITYEELLQSYIYGFNNSKVYSLKNEGKFAPKTIFYFTSKKVFYY